MILPDFLPKGGNNCCHLPLITWMYGKFCICTSTRWIVRRQILCYVWIFRIGGCRNALYFGDGATAQVVYSMN
ncbi:MAG: hypothetical protein R3C17_19275 [Planctomycetaceae bacterium]